MTLPAPASTPAPLNVREIRLGLVCYGGVSLAIYMHGITKELQRLVVASRALEDDPETNPFPRATSEHAYWQALQTARGRSADRALPRVVIDVIAGTSAGGINGVFLAKALAHNLSQDALRDLWFEKGDIKQLLGGSLLKDDAHIARFVAQLLAGKAQGPLDGEAMLGWLLDALKEMDGTRSNYQPPQGHPSSLMPDGHPLQLFVTTTDYYGFRQPITITNPATVTERRNRHIFNFAYTRNPGAERTQFDNRYNGALAFSARATSSFPGAFPPIHLADAQELPPGIVDEIFRDYEQTGVKPADTYFIDGGVLNNHPFQPAIDAIVKLRSESEVARYLLYLEPDPGSEVQNPGGEPPNYFGTIWAGLSSVAASQPILEELLRARDFNEQVRRVEELVASTQDGIAKLLETQLPHALDDQLPAADQSQLQRLGSQIEALAEQQGGYLFSPYLQLRAHSVVEQFAAGITQVCGYDVASSGLGFLVRLIVDRWARGKKLISSATSDADRRALLDQFDIAYTRRRFAFVLQGIDLLYDDVRAGTLNRSDLDQSKAAIHDRIDALKALFTSLDQNLASTVGAQIRALFPAAGLTAAIASGQDLQAFADDFLRRNGAALDAIAAQVGAYIRDEKDQLHARLYEDFREVTANWTPDQRVEVTLRFFGFPFWDAMIYPFTALSEAGELHPLEILRVSPDDSTRLGLSTAKEKLQGVKFAHFGAFLKREWRENDYLWGRLDAAERLLGLVLRPDQGFRAEDWEIKPALAAILADEKPVLTSVQPLIESLEKKVASLPDGPPA